MKDLEKSVIRMELQVEQLIRIIANMSERLEYLEMQERGRKIVSIHTRKMHEPIR